MTLYTKALALLLLSFLYACTPQNNQSQTADQEAASETNFEHLVAVVHPIGADPGSTIENNIRGVVYFDQTENGVSVKATFTGLEPGPHGFHIHQFGNCAGEDGSAAGGHYNPTNNDHGERTQDNRHMGDLGNVMANEDGNATVEFIDSKLELNGPNSILGRGIILHADDDDLESQPSGAAGPRVACGVIGIAK